MTTIIDPMKIIDQYGDDIPVPIFDILQELGLGPEFRDLDSEISGWIERRPDNSYRVIINHNHSTNRQRFTAAHELAHFMYHRDLLGDGVGDNRAYRAENTPFGNDRIQLRHERQANSVAANILMPRKNISKLEAQGIRDAKRLAQHLGVSEDAMRIRLGLPRLKQ